MSAPRPADLEIRDEALVALLALALVAAAAVPGLDDINMTMDD